MTKSSARREQLTSRPAERQRFILDHLRANGLADTLILVVVWLIGGLLVWLYLGSL